MLHPTTGIGQPEELKHILSGLYSRKIDKKHRIVYSIKEDIVTVLDSPANYQNKV